jgi:hypothetical protein
MATTFAREQGITQQKRDSPTTKNVERGGELYRPVSSQLPDRTMAALRAATFETPPRQQAGRTLCDGSDFVRRQSGWISESVCLSLVCSSTSPYSNICNAATENFDFAVSIQSIYSSYRL